MRTIRWTVGRKLLLGFGVVALLIAIMAGIGFTAIMAIQESFDKVAEDTVLELEALSKIQASALELQNETYAYVLFGAEDDLEETGEALQELDEAIELYAAAGESFDTNDEVGREMGHSLQAAIADLKAGSAEMIALYQATAAQEQIEVAGEELERAELTVEATLAEEKTALDQELAEVTAATRTLIMRVQALLVVVPVTVLVLTLGIGYLLKRSIVNPVSAITEVVRKLVIGDVHQTIEIKSRDEIGEMANAFTQMIAYQQEMAKAADRLAQGDVTANVTPQSDQDVLGHAFDRMIAYQQQMAEAASRLTQGDVTVDVTPQSDQDALGHAFTQMIAYQQQMAKAADRLAQGDLSISITPQSDQDALGQAFTQMIANLRNLISQVQQSATQVAGASQQLNTAAEDAGQASQQVTNTIQQVAQGTAQQTQSITEATHNADQMARSANGIARGAQEQAQSVQNTSDLINDMASIVDQVGQVTASVTEASTKVTQAARHGVTSVEQTSQGMATIRTRAATTADKVKEMGARSREISRIVETIDDIANKTDMLALNAAVEAARAGEHGRGFAVVADQVRKLSEDSKGATRDIDTLIERVQEAVDEAIMAMDNTTNEVDTGTKLAADTSQSLQDILQTAEEAANMAERISEAVTQLKQKSEGVVVAVESVSAVVEENTAAAEQMAANGQEITAAMEGVASIAEENSASAEEVSASAEEMSAQVEEVVASAEELSALAEELRTATAQFRLEETDQRQQKRPEPVNSPASHQQLLSVPTRANDQGDGHRTKR